MKEVHTGIFFYLTSFVSQNLLFFAMIVAAASYYQTSVSDSPTWRNVAAGSMALVGTLAGIGYRDFVNRLKKFDTQMTEDRKKRDDQHKANVAAIVALAMATSEHLKPDDKDKVQEIVKKLLED